VPFNELNVSNPVAFALNHVGLTAAGLIISFGAIAGLTTVLLVMMYGQTRVFYAMSRDGLIPPLFVKLHPTFRTPWISQILFGILIAAAGAFFPISILGSVTNMGTLVAFILVAIAVPILRKRHPDFKGSFEVPGGPYIIPPLAAITALGLIYFLKEGNPYVWGFFPLVWLAFVVWFAAGMIFYFSYGRNKSTVALEEVEGLAITQPRVN
jgi:APA family basic amino acid/polyamine antiporter